MEKDWEIPCINIEPLIKNPESDEAVQVAKKFTMAAQTFGFVTVTDHGIPLNLMHNDAVFYEDFLYRIGINFFQIIFSSSF